jgi:hypothetical protein
VIYLDADTIVQGLIDSVFSSRKTDIIARVASHCEVPAWRQDIWDGGVRKLGGSGEGHPYFNSGFVVFQNGAQHALGDRWLKAIDDLSRSGQPFTPSSVHGLGTQMVEQMALSRSIGALGIGFSKITPQEHGYLWTKERPVGKIVFHTGGKVFLSFASKMGLTAEKSARATRSSRLNRATRDSYTHAAFLACSSRAICSTASVISGS